MGIWVFFWFLLPWVASLWTSVFGFVFTCPLRKIYLFIVCFVCICECLHVCTCIMGMPGVHRGQNRTSVPCNLSYRHLRAITWEVGTKPTPSERATQVLLTPEPSLQWDMSLFFPCAPWSRAVMSQTVWEGWGCWPVILHRFGDLTGMFRGFSIPTAMPTPTLLFSLQPSFWIGIVPCCGLTWVASMAHLANHHFVAWIFIFCEETYIRPLAQFLVAVFLLLSSVV